MIRAMSCCSGERTQHVFGWISIIWFTSAVSIAGSQIVKLETMSEVQASCGDNVTLTCNVTSSQKLDVTLLTWNVCLSDSDQPDPDIVCERTEENHRLTLTLINVMPINRGRYLCKLRSDKGVASNKTDLTVQHCLESSDTFINNSYAGCRFTGVYPDSSVHWFQGDDNLTGHAITEEEEDQYGRYNILSKVNLETGNQSQPYTCSLWVHNHREYVSNQQLPMTKETKSAGSRVKLQWMCIMVEIMMLKSMA